MTCKDCIHNEMCYGTHTDNSTTCCYYKDKSRFIELPCKVGDTVYKLWYEPCHNGEYYPDSYGCCGCEDECDLKRSIFDFEVPNVDWILSHLHCFGDGVWYLTREEAEKALKERERE